jgi:hypothetical protein
VTEREGRTEEPPEPGASWRPAGPGPAEGGRGMRFRKRPVEVEAVRVDDVLEAGELGDLPRWLREAFGAGGALFEAEGIRVTTLDGVKFAPRGGWIVRGAEGELYPVPPAAFEAQYEPLEDGP